MAVQQALLTQTGYTQKDKTQSIIAPTKIRANYSAAGCFEVFWNSIGIGIPQFANMTGICQGLMHLASVLCFLVLCGCSSYTEYESKAVADLKRLYSHSNMSKTSLLCVIFVTGGDLDSINLRENIKILGEHCDIAVVSRNCTLGASTLISKISTLANANLLVYRCRDMDASIPAYQERVFLFERFIEFVPDYKYIWLVDNSISLSGLNPSRIMESVTCAFYPRPPPILSQPILSGNSRPTDYVSSDAWNSRSMIALATVFVDMELAVVDAMYFDWFVRSIIFPMLRNHKMLHKQGLRNIYCKSAFAFMKQLYGRELQASYRPCAIIVGKNSVDNQVPEEVTFSEQYLQDLSLSNAHIQVSFPLWFQNAAATAVYTEVAEYNNSQCRPVDTAVSRMKIADSEMRNISSSVSRLYAWYFPQFHQDPLNDRLWGQGFTDWDSLANIFRLKKGEPSITVPTELGYYDLLDVNTRREQGRLARMYGIDGFLYHHYYFYEKGLGASLAAPLTAMLADNEPDLPFALHWANLEWTVTWQGVGVSAMNTKFVGQRLQAQLCPEPTDPQVKDHYSFLKQFFDHKNYIKVNGMPLFLVYRNDDPNCLLILQEFRRLAMLDGYPSPGLHIPQFHKNVEHPISDIMGAVKKEVRFVKNSAKLKKMHSRVVARKSMQAANSTRLHAHWDESIAHQFQADIYYPGNNYIFGNRLPTDCIQRRIGLNETRPSYLGLITVFDNTPRRGVESADIWDRSWANNVYDSFERDLVETMLYDMCCQDPVARDAGGKFVTINAWNEWGEGMVLEPSNSYGRNFLLRIRHAKEIVQSINCDMEKIAYYDKMQGG